MPRPVSRSTPYLPGLDGLRAIAVAAVVGYHLEVPWLRGGLIGVGMFFSLSGYLITWVLLRSWDRTGDGLELRTFWIRRARRLLPAVLMLLAVVMAVTAAVEPTALGVRARESLAAAFYVANWTTIASGDSYFDRFGDPGPLDHLWSLSVEEQFYLLWPLLLLVLLRVLRGRMTRVAGVTLLLAGLSFVLMDVLSQPGFDATRVHEGTDTRAGSLLVGAAVAMIWRPDWLHDTIAPRARTIVDGVGVVSLGVVLWLLVAADPWTQMLYDWGLLVLAVATTLLVAVAVHPASRLARALGARPLVWVGERSYGIYLWHLPVIVFTPATVLADRPVLRGGLQVMTSLVLAALSWRLLEDPVRQHGLGALRPSRRQTASADVGGGVPLARRAVAFGVVATVVLAGVGLSAGLPTTPAVTILGGPASSPDTDDGGTSEATPPARSLPDDGDGGPHEGPAPGAEGADGDTREGGVPGAGGVGRDRTPEAGPTDPPPGSATPVEPAPAPAAATGPTTGCTTVTHLGDSTSIGLVDPTYVPDEADRLAARLKAVGVEDVHSIVDAALSVVETSGDRPNATTLLEEAVASGRRGCWIFAMGTNEAANQRVGGVWPFDERIRRLMEQVRGQPVLWLTVRTRGTRGPYADVEMQKFNEALVEACDVYPTMRVYDWRSEVRDEWFIPDDIHFSTEGYRERARRIAAALARAFPVDGDPPAGCLVRTDRG